MSREVLEMYSLLSYESLQSLTLRIHKMEKESLFAYISSGGVVPG